MLTINISWRWVLLFTGHLLKKKKNKNDLRHSDCINYCIFATMFKYIKYILKLQISNLHKNVSDSVCDVRLGGICGHLTQIRVFFWDCSLSDSVKDRSLKHCDRSGCYNSQRFIFTWSLQGHSSDTDAPATSYMALGQISAMFCFCLCRFNLTSHSILLSFSVSLSLCSLHSAIF